MAVVTPIWKPSLSDIETRSLRRSVSASHQADHWLLAPTGLELTWYKRQYPDSRILELDGSHFTSVHSYSRLMTTPYFYRLFQDYEFITICQTDAILIKDPSDIETHEIDYIGAPWSPPLKCISVGKRLYVSSSFGEANESRLVNWFGRPLHVGNGGLSLRRIDSLIMTTEAIQANVNQRARENVLEDALICSIGPKHGLRIASRRYAETIFIETKASGMSDNPDAFGFHGLERWNPALIELLLTRSTD